MSNKKALFLFTKGFPFGASEPFLELEYELYNKYWDKVVVVTINNSKNVRELPKWIDVIWDSNENNRYYLMLNKFLSLFRIEVWQELLILKKKNIINYNTFQEIVTTAAKGRIRSKCALKWKKKHKDYLFLLGKYPCIRSYSFYGEAEDFGVLCIQSSSF